VFKFTFFFRHGFGGADVVFQHRAHRDGTEFTEKSLAALRALYASPMARSLRIEYPGTVYHLMARGKNSTFKTPYLL
jgi:hypothetical protein